MEISRGHRLVSFRSLSCRLEASICGELTQPDSRLNQVPPFVVYPGLTTQWLLTWRWTGETLGPLWTRSQPRGTTGELHVCGGILGLACFHTWPHFFEIRSPDSWSSPTSSDYSFLVSSLILTNRCPANADSLSQTLIQGVRSPKALLPCSLWPGSPKLFFSLCYDVDTRVSTWTSRPPSLGSVVCLPCFHSLSQMDFRPWAQLSLESCRVVCAAHSLHYWVLHTPRFQWVLN